MTYSTRAVMKRLNSGSMARLNSDSESKNSLSDYVVVESDEAQNQSKEENFIIVDNPSDSGQVKDTLAFISPSKNSRLPDPDNFAPPYFPLDVDRILRAGIDQEIEEKNAELIGIIPSDEPHVDGMPFAWILKNPVNDQITMLFRTTADNAPLGLGTGSCGNSPTLDRVLSRYRSYAEQYPQVAACRLIIPVAEIVRGHFRLLNIDPGQKHGEFYDSKATFPSWAIETASSFWAWVKAHKYKYAMDTCREHFPEVNFEEKRFGHQDLCDNKHCGVFVVDYILSLMKGNKPPRVVDIYAVLKNQKSLLFKSCSAENGPSTEAAYASPCLTAPG